MSEFLNWLCVIAYFSVFFLGLFTCIYKARTYFKKRNFIKASSTVALLLTAISGLLQAIAGV